MIAAENYTARSAHLERGLRKPWMPMIVLLIAPAHIAGKYLCFWTAIPIHVQNGPEFSSLDVDNLRHG